MKINFAIFLLLLTLLPLPAFGQSQSMPHKTMVARMWHGRTPEKKGDEYFQYLYEAGIKKIEAIPGNLGVQVFRKDDGDVADFTVISYWESREAIKKFAGEDINKTHNLPKDPEYLLEMEPTVKHFDVVVNDWKQ
jgi:heme-degrading monooxygenase HmoA